jgi:hypothetical protein
MEKADPSAFRYESYPTFQQRVSLIDLSVNQPVEAEQFKLKFPKEIMVYNELTGKVLQVAADHSASDDALRRMISFGPAGWMRNRRVLFVVINVVGLGLVGAMIFVRWRRRNP